MRPTGFEPLTEGLEIRWSDCILMFVGRALYTGGKFAGNRL